MSDTPIVYDVLVHRPDTANAMRLIRDERDEQVERHGWTAEADDRHVAGELADAATAYLQAGFEHGTAEHFWPWRDDAGNMLWFKPGDRKMELVKAAALIVAELERVIRKERNDVRTADNA